MATTAPRLLVVGAAASLACLSTAIRCASADSFGSTYYDRATDQLVVTMRYEGTNPNHTFTLRWGQCQSADSDSMPPRIDAAVLDDQFRDAARQGYQLVERFSLEHMPCSRPVTVSLYTAPRNYLPIVIPK
jgi:hypothetical protein